MIEVTLFDTEYEAIAHAEAATESEVIAILWPKVKCEDGPLSGDVPATIIELSDRVADAYGGEYYIDASGD